MKAHYRRIAKQLKQARARLRRISETRDLPDLHRFAVDLQNSMPEAIAHEYLPLFIDGLGVDNEEAIPVYAERLDPVLTQLLHQYRKKAGEGE
ncbi:hypothetical protein GF324_00815 [bacterium]|nr:hypothetical protein [bacterium]